MTLDDFFEDVDDEHLPPIDRREAAPSGSFQRTWRDDGFLILPGFLDEQLMADYCRVRAQHSDPMGYPSPTAYRDVPELAALCCDGRLSRIMEALIGEPAAVHLNLTGWVSSQRDWHADSFLSPQKVGGYYVAAWMALDTISPQSGPFEFIPGSHRPAHRKLSQAKIVAEIQRRGHAIAGDWAKHSEEFLSELIETEIVRRGWQPRKFLAKHGDVLLWHSGLIHRGSPAIRLGMPRRALIAHYTGINHKHSDQWPAAVQHQRGGWLYPF